MKPNPEIDQLLSSLDALEQQRDILGDLIDPTIAQVEERIRAQLPEPTAAQKQIYESWQTVVKTTEELGLPTPEPTVEIIEVTSAIQRYDQVLQRIGTTGLLTSAVENVSDLTELPPAPAPAPAAISHEPISSEPTAPPTVKAKPSTPEEITDPKAEVIISDGESEFRPKESIQEMYRVILKKLAESVDHALDTTTFLRDLTGTTPRQASLALAGRVNLGSIDPKHATKVIKQFYQALGVLKRRNLVEHIPGSAPSVPGVANSNPGIVRSFAPINFSEQDGVLRIEIMPKPYEIGIDLYHQSIDNGRGKKVEFDKDALSFLRVSQALGSISLRTESEQTKFSRSKLAEWMSEHYNVNEGSVKSLAKVSYDLKDVIDAFHGDFPLSTHGVRGGAYYSWKNDTKVEAMGGWPDKPRFNDPVYITIEPSRVMATIDGEAHILFDYEKVESTFGAINIGLETLVERNKMLFDALSIIGQNDQVSSADLIKMMYGNDISPQLQSSVSAWFRLVARKLNSFGDDQIINWKALQGVRIDLNRSIVVNNSGHDPSDSAAQEEPVVIVDLDEAQPKIELQLDSNEADVVDKVDRRKTANEIVQAMEALDERTKKIIHGRLVEHGRFEYPTTLEEAAYLLKLLSSDGITAQVRENGRFLKHDATAYKDFIAEALYACYVRTLSWGDFRDLAEAVSQSHADMIPSSVKLLTQSFEQATQSARDSLTSARAVDSAESVKNRSFMDDALEKLVEGWVPKPQNPIQAIGLLDIFRINRRQIAEGKTQSQFDALISDLHEYVADQIGKGNTTTTIDIRGPRRSAFANRAVLTAGGEEGALHRTDTHRYPDHSSRPHRRRRGGKS